MLEHKELRGFAFARRYKLADLVYFEEISGIAKAIQREKQLKNWHRDWKINLIRELNPEMIDLAENWR